MTLLGWGFDPYGTSGFGAAAYTEGVSILTAVATTTKEVRVYLTDEPKHSSAVAPGDALNPATWSVQRLDGPTYLNVASVVEYAPTVYGIQTMQALGPASVVHEVSSVTLQDAGGGIILPPRKAQFAGLIDEAAATAQAKLAKRGAIARDVANPQAPRGAPDVFGGTLVVGSSGDYDTVTGLELIKKLIIRRLTTREGEFFHLPNYGVTYKTKETIQPGSLRQLKASIERQILKEPEVSDASATIRLDANNVLTVAIKAITRPTGEQLQFSIPSVVL
jgi:hypothetical protein